MNMKAEYNAIKKETEKAMLIDFRAIGRGQRDPKPVWVPKSQIAIISEKLLTIPSWLIDRIEKENSMMISCEAI